MFLVLADEFVWIEKNFNRCLKMYTMLGKVNLIFLLIPFKGSLVEIKIEILVHRQLLSRGLYHGEIQFAIHLAIRI